MLTTGELSFRVVTPRDAADIVGWAKPALQTAALLDRDNAYYSILSADGALAGFCCFGRSAHVAGGDYQAQAVDLGSGLRPDVGGGEELGEVVRGVTLFARALFNVMPLRTTVPVSQRVIRAWESAGFLPLGRFTGTDGEDYLQLALPPSNLG